MNQLNEMLASIRRKKTVYLKELKETDDNEKQKQLSVMIDELSAEEKQILNQLDVPI